MTEKPKQDEMAGEVDPELDFETALNELESVVEKMESGDLKLDESLAAFQKGVALARLCQNRLDQAEQTVEALTDLDDPDSGEPLPELE